MSALLQCSLFCTEGHSDKVYAAEVIEVPGGNVVNFRYGRRGSTLTTGTKTAVPVDFEQAKKILLKLQKEKLAKGYCFSPDESSSYQDNNDLAARKTDFVPQLLNAITEEQAQCLIEDDEWCLSEKKDGERRAAHAEASIVIGMNRKGLAVPLPMSVADELQLIAANTGAVRVDGESIGDFLYVFDLHIYNSKAIGQSLGFLARIELAKQMFAHTKYVRVIPVAVTTADKRALWDKVKAEHGEGLVFKRINCLVTENRPSSGGDWLKFKFYASATCIVTAINVGKRSVAIGLLGKSSGHVVAPGWIEHGSEIIPIGNVTIPINAAIPVPGSLVEVAYLYAFVSGSLYQPIFLGERTDIDFSACTQAQLKYKPEGTHEEDEEEIT